MEEMTLEQRQALALAAARLRLQDKNSAVPAQEVPAPVRFLQNAAAGAVRGAGSIGATLLARPEDLGAALRGRPSSISERTRAMDDVLGGFGADTDSLAYGGGKLAAEIAGTAGIGGGAANVLRGLGVRSAPLLTALETAGFRTGAAPATMAGRAGDLALRSAAGAGVGAASAGMVNPQDAATGGVIGAALPGALQGIGAAGRGVGSLFRSGEKKAGERLARALDAMTPEEARAVAARLQSGREIVPGSKPTVAQLLRTPQASILEDVVGDSSGGALLKQRYLDQNAARLNALQGVASIDPRGFRSAQQDMGEAAIRYGMGADKSARAAISATYQQLPQDQALLYLPPLAPIRDQYFGPAVVGGRQAVDAITDTAQRIGTESAPAIVPTRAGKAPKSLAQAVRSDGGIKKGGDLGGEIRALGKDLKNLTRKDARSADLMAERMREAGYITDEGGDDLVQALRDEASGRPMFSIYDLPEQQWQASREAAMGEPPAASAVAKKVTLKDFEDLRKSIGNAQRAAMREPERAVEAKALGAMKDALDQRIDEVVRGDGAIDENLPIEWADQLSRARALKRKQVETFRTGPQAAIFRQGGDNMPLVQGGELMQKVWGSRPGVAADVAQFRKMIDAEPRLLGQFRSMVATEGAGTVTQGGNLTGKFVKWVENTLPGLKATFEPDQVKALERIAADIKRAEVAKAARMTTGSKTYANAQNALDLGLLDNPLLGAVASQTPVIGRFSGPALNWMRDTARQSQAKTLAQLLADPQAAGNALQQVFMPRSIALDPLSLSILRAAPVLAADQ